MAARWLDNQGKRTQNFLDLKIDVHRKRLIKSLEELIKAKHKKRNEDSNLIASLKAENDDLKDEAVKWNRKHYKLDEKYYELNKKHNDLIDNNTTKLKFH